MAQAGFTPISLYFSTTAAAVPTAGNLVAGELALNTVDEKLYFKNSAGTVKLLASNATSAPVLSFQTSLGGLTPSTATTGVVTLAGTLNTTSGGTGLTSFTAGDVPYYASGTLLSKLAIGTAGQFLTSTGTAPQWSTLSGVAVTTFSAGTTGFTPSSATSGAVTLAGTLATANGGTNLGGATPFTSGGVVYASSASVLATGSALTFDGNGAFKSAGSTDGYISSTFVNTSAGTSAVTRIQIGNNTSDGAGQIVVYGGNHSTLASVMDINNANNADLRFLTNNTERVRLTSSSLYTASGISVGIGTSSPVYQTQIYGTGQTTAALTDAGNKGGSLLLNTPTVATGDGGALLIGAGGSGAKPFAAIKGLLADGAGNTTGALAFSTRNATADVALTERMRLDTAGNVGIGTSSPTNTLSLKSETDANIKFEDTTSGTAGYVGPSANNQSDTTAQRLGIRGEAGVAFSVGSATKMVLDSSGNVGIGTTSPLTKFDVLGPNDVATFRATNANSSYIGFYYNTSTLSGFVGNGSSILSAASNSDFIVRSEGALKFATSGNNLKATLDTSGTLGVGNFTPYSTWGGSYVALQVQSIARTLAATGAGAGDLTLAFNAVYDSTDSRWEFAGTGDKAGRYSQTGSGDSHVWYVTNTNGTAGNAITFTQVMTLDSSANLYLGLTPVGGSAKFVVKPSSTYGMWVSNGFADSTPYGLEFGLQPGQGSYRSAVRGFPENYGGTDSGALAFYTSNSLNAGAISERMRITSAGNVGIGTTSPGGKLHVYAGASGTTATSEMMLTVENSSTSGIGILAPAANESIIYFGSPTSNIDGGIIYNHPNRAMVFRTAGNTERARIDSSGNLLVGKTAAGDATAGAQISASGRGGFVRSSGDPLYINRLADDGILVTFDQATVTEGSISVSGTTVSYNGGHLSRWAQTTTAKDDSLLKGTVLSNLDAMNVYTDAEGNPVDNEQLNKVKVSNTEGDVNVAGVFVNWSHDDAHNVDEINMAMTGDMIIRIAQGVTVVRGDLLMSAGDGTAKPQGDDIVRSKTVAKVTSNHITCTYADGSYCVPCVLMAC